MSAIHEAIKKAREARQEKSPAAPSASATKPSLTLKSPRQTPPWLWWAMLFFVLAEGALYLYERQKRARSEDKMRLAYLELNDVRGEVIDSEMKQSATKARIAQLEARLGEAEEEKARIESAKQRVEFENLDKEKKVSKLTKEMHEVEMTKFQLQDEIKALKAELEKRSVPEPAPSA
jgi:hypothetical protein